MMVTGDHPLTAAAIARKIGLITLPTKESLAKERGVPISQIPPDDVKAVVVRAPVYKCHEDIVDDAAPVGMFVLNRFMGQRSLR